MLRKNKTYYGIKTLLYLGWKEVRMKMKARASPKLLKTIH